MSLSREAIKTILGIKETVELEPAEMAKNLTVTFFPLQGQPISENVKSFSEQMIRVFRELGVVIISYEDALTDIPFWKKAYLFMRFVKKALKRARSISHIRFGKKVRSGITIVALGESRTGNLPMDNIADFRESNVITIVDMPAGINKDTDFHKHFDTAMSLFVHHMTNIIIAVSDKEWILYNLNASHPTYSRTDEFKEHVLHALIPKIAAPIRPNRFSEFIVRQQAFNPRDALHAPVVRDLLESGLLLEKTGLYPPGKKIEDLPFRNAFYKWVGSVHLDERTGMSYGFLARQMPLQKFPEVLTLEEGRRRFGEIVDKEKDYFSFEDNVFLLFHTAKGKFITAVPEVWVITLRSGANKTHPDPQKDLVKLGLKNGKMILESPIGLTLKPDYKPSFDTKVILAHAVGNAVVGAILKYIYPHNKYSEALEKRGLALAHWHGYLEKKVVPEGWHIHGETNPHVACSTPQSAIFALEGKIQAFLKSLAEEKPYHGDIHIEPHHGTNITFSSLKELGEFLVQHADAVSLGNHYLDYY